ncbi:MAG: hypothetical protein ACI8QS_002526 [Planctomycetota bacterium]|jgi:hypothetical protein
MPAATVGADDRLMVLIVLWGTESSSRLRDSMSAPLRAGTIESATLGTLGTLGTLVLHQHNHRLAHRLANVHVGLGVPAVVGVGTPAHR